MGQKWKLQLLNVFASNLQNNQEPCAAYLQSIVLHSPSHLKEKTSKDNTTREELDIERHTIQPNPVLARFDYRRRLKYYPRKRGNVQVTVSNGGMRPRDPDTEENWAIKVWIERLNDEANDHNDKTEDCVEFLKDLHESRILPDAFITQCQVASMMADQMKKVTAAYVTNWISGTVKDTIADVIQSRYTSGADYKLQPSA